MIARFRFGQKREVIKQALGGVASAAYRDLGLALAASRSQGRLLVTVNWQVARFTVGRLLVGEEWNVMLSAAEMNTCITACLCPPLNGGPILEADCVLLPRMMYAPRTVCR